MKVAPAFQKEGRKWENVWRKWGKGRERIKELAKLVAMPAEQPAVLEIGLNEQLDYRVQSS